MKIDPGRTIDRDLMNSFNEELPRQPLLEIAGPESRRPRALQHPFYEDATRDLVVSLRGWRGILIGHVKGATSVFDAAHSHLDDISNVTDHPAAITKEIDRIERNLGIKRPDVEVSAFRELIREMRPSSRRGLLRISRPTTPSLSDGGAELWASPAEIPSGRSSSATLASSPPVGLGVRRSRGRDDDMMPPPARRQRLNSPERSVIHDDPEDSSVPLPSTEVSSRASSVDVSWLDIHALHPHSDDHVFASEQDADKENAQKGPANPWPDDPRNSRTRSRDGGLGR